MSSRRADPFRATASKAPASGEGQRREVTPPLCPVYEDKMVVVWSPFHVLFVLYLKDYFLLHFEEVTVFV